MYQKQHQDQQEGSIDNIISTIPIVLDSEDKAVKKAGKFYLPFSTGFEIECDMQPEFDINSFKNIPNILDVQCDSAEQRFRIPKGIKGLKCLYSISQELKRNSLLNPASGIHYHIDFTEYYHLLNEEFVGNIKEWVLNELDTWEYKGTYNTRNIAFNASHNWVRFQSGFKTLEFRIGEMTFDYELLFKRITHCNDIVKRISKLITNQDLKEYNINILYNTDVEGVLKNRKKFI